MAGMMNTPRRAMKPPRPVTPLGQDLPEDTPSKIRARNAKECASIRKRLEKEAVAAELETGLELHAQLMQNRARKRAEAKADGALRRERTARAAADKLQARQLEADRERQQNARDAEERKAAEALDEAVRLARIAESRQQRQIRLEMAVKMKQTAAQLEADERSLAAKEYEAGLADRRRKEAEEKAMKKEHMQRRKEEILEARERRAEERAAAIEAMRQEVEAAREAAKAREAERIKAAEEHRQTLRARAPDYKQSREVAKTSAFAR